ncbi:hypothetical protein JYT23_00070 [Mariprofundus ferrooxydans]|nr:hypothetical protein [Mariprofundus ferrooxydans]
MQQGGFVDLRLNQLDSDEQSFWPTFTDIMTVIVLIFLLAMLTLLVKNMDLVDQLRASLDSERAATAQAQSTSSRNTALNLRLRSLEEESAMLRMRLMDLGEEHSRTLTQLSSSEAATSKLVSELSAMTQARNVILDEKEELQRSQLELKKTQAELQQNKAELMAQLAQRAEALAEQQRQYHLNLEAMGLLKTDNKVQLERLKRLELEYANLDTKYKRLIRPARSHLGKAVVFVRYHKQDGKLSIEIKAPDDGQYVPVNGITLHKRLSALQQKLGKKLYVRIIFPDDSGLSYTEAWNLTESLLRLYDYYYQQ